MGVATDHLNELLFEIVHDMVIDVQYVRIAKAFLTALGNEQLVWIFFRMFQIVVFLMLASYTTRRTVDDNIGFEKRFSERQISRIRIARLF